MVIVVMIHQGFKFFKRSLKLGREGIPGLLETPYGAHVETGDDFHEGVEIAQNSALLANNDELFDGGHTSA